MTSVLALDLGTNTGFAIGSKGHIVSGTWSFKPHKSEGGGMRYLKFMKKINEICTASKPDIVYFEEIRRHLGTDAGHVYGGLAGILMAFCEGKGIPYCGVSVGQIKRSWTGKGNADKDAMVAEARRRGFTPIDDNEADALALFHMKIDEFDEEVKSNENGIAGVEESKDRELVAA